MHFCPKKWKENENCNVLNELQQLVGTQFLAVYKVARHFYKWTHLKSTTRTKNTLDCSLTGKIGVVLWKLPNFWGGLRTRVTRSTEQNVKSKQTPIFPPMHTHSLLQKEHLSLWKNPNWSLRWTQCRRICCWESRSWRFRCLWASSASASS